MSHLEHRLAVLEKANRWQRVGLVVALSAIATMLCIAANGRERTADVVTAREIKVVNADGQDVVHISGKWAGGVGGIRVRRPGGEHGVVIWSDKEGGHISAYNPDQVVIFKGGAAANGHGSLAVFEAKGKGRARLGIDTKGGSTLLLSDAGGLDKASVMADDAGGRILLLNRGSVAAMTMGITDEGNGQFDVLTAAGNTAASVGVDEKNDAGAVWLLNREGKMIVSAGADKNNGGRIELSDRNGAPRAGIGAARAKSGGSLWIMNDEGKEIISVESDREKDGLIEVSDSRGLVRMAIGVDADGAGTLAASNRDGKDIALVGSDANGGRVEVLNLTGRTAAKLDVDKGGHGRAVLYKLQGKGKVLKP